MPIKLTKRKGFNFFRSYYDVYNELETNEDKVAFIDALLDRQFLGIKPTNLKGMAKFAYISQTNSIDSQVKGYEDKMKVILHPTQGGTVGGSYTPCLQVEVKEKEEVNNNTPAKADDVFDFSKYLETLNQKFSRSFKVVNEKTKKQIKARLKEKYTKQDIIDAMNNCLNSDFHKNNGYQYCTPEFFSRADILDRWSDITKPKQSKVNIEL